MLCRWSRCVRYLAAKSYVQVLREPGHDVRAEEQGDGRQKVSALDVLPGRSAPADGPPVRG